MSFEKTAYQCIVQPTFSILNITLKGWKHILGGNFDKTNKVLFFHKAVFVLID
jgi:hypothetical protein